MKKKTLLISAIALSTVFGLVGCKNKKTTAKSTTTINNTTASKTTASKITGSKTTEKKATTEKKVTTEKITTEKNHVHNYSTDYEYDDESHYKICKCGSKIDVESHDSSFEFTEASGSGDKVTMKCECACGYEKTGSFDPENLNQVRFEIIKSTYLKFANNYNNMSATISMKYGELDSDNNIDVSNEDEVSYDLNSGSYYNKYNNVYYPNSFVKIVNNNGTIEYYSKTSDNYNSNIADDVYSSVLVKDAVLDITSYTALQTMASYDDFSKYYNDSIPEGTYIITTCDSETKKAVLRINNWEGGTNKYLYTLTLSSTNSFEIRYEMYQYNDDDKMVGTEVYVYEIKMNYFDKETYDAIKINYNDDEFKQPDTAMELGFSLAYNDGTSIYGIGGGAALVGSTTWVDKISCAPQFNKDYFKYYYDKECKIEIASNAPFKSDMGCIYVTYTVPAA